MKACFNWDDSFRREKMHPHLEISRENKHMKRKICIVLAASILLLGSNVSAVSAGVKPSPFQREINQLHSIELNIAALDSRIAKLPDSTASPEGIVGQVQAIADKLVELDRRLADVLFTLPSLDASYDGRDEVIATLGSIKTNTGNIRAVAARMGIIPSPWQSIALAVKTNAETLMDRVQSTCPLGIVCWAPEGNLVIDIKANGSDGPITITTTDLLTITVSLNPGVDYGKMANYYIVVNTFAGWYHYEYTSLSWEPDFGLTYRGSVLDLSSFKLLDRFGLPVGEYTFFFFIGLDTGQLNSDSVKVNIN